MNEKVPPEDAEPIQSGYLGVSPKPGQLPERGKRQWVDRPEMLLDAVDVLKQFKIVAIDAEFTQIRSHSVADAMSSTSSHRLALLQLAVDGYCYIIDALRLNDLSPLAKVIENPEYSILLHGAGSDIRVMAERGLNVAHYFDLEATSRSIFGQHESSLASMLLRAFNVRLDKSLQRTDWTRRPLPPAMVAYAARDAEMTLALYHWLHQYYPEALQLHEHRNEPEPVAPWIETFLRSSSSVSPEQVISEAKALGIPLDEAQMCIDCRAALATLTHPIRRGRLLRLIADLHLQELVPTIELLLQSSASDERAASVRALGRLGMESSRPLINSLLNDPVQDVRKAAQTALRNLENKDGGQSWVTPATLTDGARQWTVGETNQADDQSDWKARLRAMMGE